MAPLGLPSCGTASKLFRQRGIAEVDRGRRDANREAENIEAMVPKAVVKSDLSEHQRISTVTTGGDDSGEEGFNRKQNRTGRTAKTQLFSLSSASEWTLGIEQEELPEDKI